MNCAVFLKWRAFSNVVLDTFLIFSVVNSPTAMLKMYETPHANASMMTANVMRKRRTSFIMWLMLKMIGPKYFEAIPTCVKARTKSHS